MGPVAGQHEAGRPPSGRGEGVGRHGRLARADLVRDRDRDRNRDGDRVSVRVSVRVRVRHIAFNGDNNNRFEANNKTVILPSTKTCLGHANANADHTHS